MVLVDLRLFQFGLSLLLKCDDDESDEDVDEEEGEDDEVDDVEDGHLHPEERDRGLVREGSGHGLLQDPVRERKKKMKTFPICSLGIFQKVV